MQGRSSSVEPRLDFQAYIGNLEPRQLAIDKDLVYGCLAIVKALANSGCRLQAWDSMPSAGMMRTRAPALQGYGNRTRFNFTDFMLQRDCTHNKHRTLACQAPLLMSLMSCFICLSTRIHTCTHACECHAQMCILHTTYIYAHTTLDTEVLLRLTKDLCTPTQNSDAMQHTHKDPINQTSCDAAPCQGGTTPSASFRIVANQKPLKVQPPPRGA